MSISNEDYMLDGLRSGDEKTFKAIVEKFKPGILNYVTAILKDHEQAQDVTQDTFKKLWERRESFNDMEHIKLFLIVTARNKSFDVLRKLKTVSTNQPELEYLQQQEEDTQTVTERNEIETKALLQINELIKKLPPKEREAFTGKYIQGKDPTEIAREMGVTKHTVQNRISSALQWLRNQFKNLDRDEFK